MKKVILFFIFILSVKSINAQITDSVGRRQYYANVAVITRYNHFAFRNGEFNPEGVISKGLKDSMRTVVNAYLDKYFLGAGFRIVNRDDNTYNEISGLLKENMSEDYLNGYQVQAKGQGADFLIIAETTNMVNESSGSISDIYSEFSTRMINLQNNVGVHSRQNYFYKEDGTFSKLREYVTRNNRGIVKSLNNWFPRVYAPVSNKGNKIYWGVTKPFGTFIGDNFYIWEFSTERRKILGKEMPFDIINLIDTKEYKELKIENGYTMIKSNKVKDLTKTIMTASATRPALANQGAITVTLISLPYDEVSMEGFMRKLINNSITGAIGETSLTYIENEFLNEIKKERELQKSEEFIEGHIVEQMKAVGAQYYIKPVNIQLDTKNMNIKLNLEFHSVSENSLLKSIPIDCHITKLQEFVKKAIYDSFSFYCNVTINDKIVELYSPMQIYADEGEKFDLFKIASITNPLTGEAAHQKIKLMTLKYKEYHGLKHILEVDKIQDKEAVKNVDWENDILLYAKTMDELNPKAEYDSSGNTFLKKMSRIGKGLLKNVKVNIF